MRKGTKRMISLLVVCMMLFTAADFAVPVFSVAEDRAETSASERRMPSPQTIRSEDIATETDESTGTEESNPLPEEETEDLQNDPEIVSTVTASVNPAGSGGESDGYIEIPVEDLYRYFKITDDENDTDAENAGENSVEKSESVETADPSGNGTETQQTADTVQAADTADTADTGLKTESTKMELTADTVEQDPVPDQPKQSTQSEENSPTQDKNLLTDGTEETDHSLDGKDPLQEESSEENGDSPDDITNSEPPSDGKTNLTTVPDSESQKTDDETGEENTESTEKNDDDSDNGTGIGNESSENVEENTVIPESPDKIPETSSAGETADPVKDDIQEELSLMADSLTYGDLTYTVNNNEVTITDCDPGVTSVTIPAQINGMNVVAIGNYAFDGCSNLTNLTIPEGVESLGHYLIRGTAISSITVPSTVTSSGYYASGYYNGALAGCTTLKEVIFAQGATVIPAYICASNNQTSYIERIVIPDSVTSIGNYAFYKCASLREGVDIPRNTRTIGYSAFQGCTSLTEVTMNYNDTVEWSGSIGDYAFADCISLSDVRLAGSYKELGNYLFSGCSSLRNLTIPEGVKSLGYYLIRGTAISSITVPSTVTSSGYYASGYYNGALAGCTTLKEVIFAQGATVIPAYICASNNQTSYIERIVIPDSVTSIGNYAFYKCASLREGVDIPRNTRTIGYSTFQGCTSLTEVTMNYNDTVEWSGSIGDYAFADCISLSDVRLAGSYKELGNYLFSGCTSLKNLTIPEGVKSLGYYLIRGTAISSITVPSTVTSSGYYASGYYNGALAGCTTLKEVIFAQGATVIPAYICASNNQTSYIERIVIPDSVTSIGNHAFYKCASLREGVDIPRNTRTIGYSAFQGCTSLTEVTMNYNDTVEWSGSIGDYAFADCISLSDVRLAGSYKELGNYLFSGCSSLRNLTIPEGVKSLGYYLIRGTAISSITVPSTVTSSGYYASGYYNGALAGCTTLKEVIFAQGATVIPAYICASNNQTSYIERIVIPDSVTSIGNHAFYKCASLREGVDIPRNTRTIGYSAFQGCTSLTEVTMNYNDTVEWSGSIGDYAFADCISLSDVRLAGSYKELGNYLFSGCTSLKNLTIPEGVKSLGYYLIRGTAISSITVPSTVTSSGYYASGYYNGALAGCTTLSEVIFTQGTMAIPSYICASNSQTSYIEKVYIPPTVQSVGQYAFYKCDNMAIYCADGSYAHQYAIENNIPFVLGDFDYGTGSSEPSEPGAVGAIRSVNMTRGGNVYNLLTVKQSFEKGSSDTASITVTVDWGDSSEGMILLSQSGEKYMQAANGNFGSFAPGKYFEAGEVIYAIAVDAHGNTLESKRLNLYITEPELSGEIGGDHSFGLFDAVSFTVPEDKPVLGNQSLISISD